jgi:hypothetical protein
MIEKMPSPVRGIVARPAGPAAIGVSWSAAPAAENVTRYIVYRIIGNATLFSVNGQSHWEPRPFAYEQGLVDSFTTTATTLLDTSVRMGMPYVYRVAAIDNEGTRGPVAMPSPPAFDTYVVTIPLTTDIVLRGGQWHMIGAIGLDTLSFGSSENRYLYRWDDTRVEDRLYSRYRPSTVMAPSRGYWFWSAHDTILTVGPARLQAMFASNPAAAVELTIDSSGWNQIASPFPFAIAPRWLDDFEIFGWDPVTNAYEPAIRLEPGRAYWVQTDGDTLLGLDSRPALGDSSLPTGGPLAKTTAALAWELCLSLEGEKSADPSNFIGVIPTALAKGVRSESGEPPPAFDYPQLFFVRSGNPASGVSLRERLSRQYKSAEPIPEDKLTWTVGISPSSTPVTIRIEGVEGVPEPVHLYWVSERGSVNLRGHTEISMPAREQTTYARVVATTKPAQIAAYTGRFELHHPSPNPFVHSTTLRFVVPCGWDAAGPEAMRRASLRIYDIDGRLVATPLSRPVPPGLQRTAWDGRTDGGAPAPSGYYIARLVVGNHAKAVRLLKVE